MQGESPKPASGKHSGLLIFVIGICTLVGLVWLVLATDSVWIVHSAGMLIWVVLSWITSVIVFPLFQQSYFRQHTLDQITGEVIHSVAIGSDGKPVIAYTYNEEGGLRIVKCGDSHCTSGNTITTVDAGRVYEIAVTIGQDGNPVIYYNEDMQPQSYQITPQSKVAECLNPTCTKSKVTKVENITFSVDSMAFAPNRFPIIAMGGEKKLSAFSCTNQRCTQGTLHHIDEAETYDLYRNSQVQIGTDGLPVIMARLDVHPLSTQPKKNAILIARCEDEVCSRSSVTRLKKVLNLGSQSSFRLSSDNKPILFGYDWDGQKLLVFCTDRECTHIVETEIDSQGRLDSHSQLLIEPDGKPLIVHIAWGGSTLKTDSKLYIVKCLDATCVKQKRTLMQKRITYGAINALIGVDGLPLLVYKQKDGDLVAAYCKKDGYSQ